MRLSCMGTKEQRGSIRRLSAVNRVQNSGRQSPGRLPSSIQSSLRLCRDVSKAHKPYAEVREPDSAVQHQWGSYSWRVRYYSCGRLSSCRPESLAYSRLVKFARPEQNMTALLFPSMDQYVSDHSS